MYPSEFLKNITMSNFKENQKAFDAKAKELEELDKIYGVPEAEEPMTIEEATKEDEELKIWEIFKRANEEWRRLNNIKPDEQD
ncbi:MAG: hypothetical protein HC913_05245 [Microscillaceae bacterium]|nr:hypothetical protein [Microscillaceae bacterium]